MSMLGFAVDPTAWCTDAGFASWNCNCDSFNVSTGVGIVTDCLIEQDCGKCNTTDSCLDVIVSADMREDEYDYQVCHSYDVWSLCMEETVEVNDVGNILMESCSFTVGGSEFCCTSSDSAECGAAFCAEDSSTLPTLSMDMCLLLSADCPLLEGPEGAPPTPAPTKTSAPFADTSMFRGNETTTSPTSDQAAMNGTVEVEWEMDFCGTSSSSTGTVADSNSTNSTGIPDDCGITADAASSDGWYSFVGNGDFLQLIPSCSGELGNVTFSVVAGSCESLTCVMKTDMLDISCTEGLNLRRRRHLQPQVQAEGEQEEEDPASDFLSTAGVTYFIHVGGIEEDILFLEEFPFEIVSLGPGSPTQAPVSTTAVPTRFSTAAPSAVTVADEEEAGSAPSTAPKVVATTEGNQSTKKSAATSIHQRTYQQSLILLCWVAVGSILSLA